MSDKSMEETLDEIMNDAYDKATAEPVEEKDEEPVQEEVQEEEIAEEVPEEEPDEEIIEESAPVEQAVVAPKSQAPDHWSSAAKALWDKLDPVVRADTLKQQEFIKNLQSKHDTERNKYAAIDSVLEGRRDMLRANYGDEAQGLKSLFALSDFATKDPAGFVRWFSQQRGVDLRGLVQSAAPQAVDPNVQALKQEIATLQGNLNSLTQQQENALIQQMDEQFKVFANNPENKYVNDEKVRDDMAFLLEHGRAQTFEDAYKMAVNLNPAIQEQMLADMQQPVVNQVDEQTKEAVNKAKRAKARNVATKAVSKEKPVVTQSWEETMDSVGDKLFA